MALKLPPAIIQKTMRTQALQFKNGLVLLWGTPVFLMPIQMSALIWKTLEDEFGEEARKIIYFTGKVQARQVSK